jgi:hypothetical protein
MGNMMLNQLGGGPGGVELVGSDSDEGRLSEEAFVRDFAGDLPEDNLGR